eukprot:m.116304 g.116304  ORF g.116304 m.116304 type:complete len:110 (-) comp15396_c2_seq1:73-402(-)
MSSVAALCHFCELHGPQVLLTTLSYRLATTDPAEFIASQRHDDAATVTAPTLPHAAEDDITSHLYEVTCSELRSYSQSHHVCLENDGVSGRGDLKEEEEEQQVTSNTRQ